ncbi:MAG: hypothetical protein HOI66_08145 [Verrucomicrobia bacterium]|nr:hypothetical protein [Verrucomicrobiota bacterium]
METTRPRLRILKRSLSMTGLAMGLIIGWQAWTSFDVYLQSKRKSNRIESGWNRIWKSRDRDQKTRENVASLEEEIRRIDPSFFENAQQPQDSRKNTL